MGAEIEAALAASKEHGPTSKEARVLWDIVEEMDASDNSAAFKAATVDPEYAAKVKDLNVLPLGCPRGPPKPGVPPLTQLLSPPMQFPAPQPLIAPSDHFPPAHLPAARSREQNAVANPPLLPC